MTDTTLKCHECGAEFGASAMTCPKCGVKTKRPATQWERLILAAACLAFLAPFFPWGMFAAEKPATEETQPVKDGKKAEGKTTDAGGAE